MNSYSIETQFNAISLAENSKIADVYQRMLHGDKFALASLQKIKVNEHKNQLEKQYQQKLSSSIHTNKSYHQKQLLNDTKLQSPLVKEFSYQQTSPVSKNSLHKQTHHQLEKLDHRQKQKFRSFIKNKVNELRTEKSLLKNQEEEQIERIKKISNNIKFNTTGQSKSYDLVKKKEKFNNQTSLSNNHTLSNNQKQGKIEHAKRRFQSADVHEKIQKAGSSQQHNVSKHLPPLRQKKKVPTENSEKNTSLPQSKLISRKEARTPVNLANSTFQTNKKQNTRIQDKKVSRLKHSQLINFSVNKNEQKQKKLTRSQSIKVSLPQMKKQREQFTLMNERQRNMQSDLVQYHQQTKRILQDIRIKYQLDFRNEQKLRAFKTMFDPEPIVNTLKNKNNASISSINGEEHQQNKRPFQVHEEKINESFKDIQLIEEMISKRTNQIPKFSQKLNKNKLYQFWAEHGLYTSDFQFYEEEALDQNVQNSRTISESTLQQAYSTSMLGIKDKNWKSKVIKQYDTNRSFQQYAKSRAQVKQPHNLKQSGLKQIKQTDQLEQTFENKITVNSRLKKLLLQ